MRYLVFVKMAEDVGDAPQEIQEAMWAAMQQAFADGVMLDAGGLWPAARSTAIRLVGGAIVGNEGPFAEAKEEVGGYSIIEVRSEEKAVANARMVIELHQE